MFSKSKAMKWKYKSATVHSPSHACLTTWHCPQRHWLLLLINTCWVLVQCWARRRMRLQRMVGFYVYCSFNHMYLHEICRVTYFDMPMKPLLFISCAPASREETKAQRHSQLLAKSHSLQSSWDRFIHGRTADEVVCRLSWY